MEGLGTLLFYALLFYLIMRFGCGAHMVHGHGNHGSHQDSGWYIALIWVPLYNVFASKSACVCERK